uniref:Putative secreted peptide n=1 Tax=Rhipicephalus pulchellus TaxID=72859 RepID=L7MC98_RHIPC
MDLVCFAVVLTSMLPTLVFCGEAYDHRTLPKAVIWMMGNATALLNSTQRLVLYWGVNGAMDDKLICWMTNKTGQTYPHIYHDIYFLENVSDVSSISLSYFMQT